MMDAFRSNVAMIAQMAAAGVAKPRLGLVSSYDPTAYAVKVKLQPAPADDPELETGWMPIWSPWVGNQWGLYCPPQVGDQVLVLFEEGDVERGVCIGGLFSDVDRPLSGVPSKEFWLVHESGSSLKFTNDGSVALNVQKDLTATVAGNATVNVTGDINSQAANWTHTGPLHVTGDINCDQTVTATTDVVGGGKSLKSHTHSGVTTGTGDTGPPV